MLGARTFLLVASAVCGFASAAAGQAALAGSVLSDPGELPIANAEITIRDVNRTARSDSAGNFTITGIAPGDHSVMVRLAGYQAWIGSLTFVDGKTIEADFMMKPVVAKLAAVEVKAPETLYALRLRDFDERRKQGTGHFLTTDVFRQSEGRHVADILLGRIPGLRMVGNTDFKVANSTHDGRGTCPVQVVVNDLLLFNGLPGQEPFNVNSVNASDVLGVEYYSTAETPLRFMNTGAPTQNRNPQGAACGTLVIWTR